MMNNTTEIVKIVTFVAAACMAVTSTAFNLLLPNVSLVIPVLLSAVVSIAIAIPVTSRILGQRDQIEALKRQVEASETTVQSLKIQHEKSATVDKMTGLSTRQHFMDSTINLRKMAVNGALVIIDVDGIKKINDRFGNTAGDAAIAKTAFAVDHAVRPGDVLGRIGGEEFAVYLSDVSKEQALMVAERIRSNVASINFNPDGRALWPLSVSIGVTMDTHLDDLQKIMKRADLALFDAKRNGSDRVSYCRPEVRDMVA